MAGSFELVGLDQIKEALGTRWADLAARASQAAEQGIRRRLSDSDILQVLSDTEFSICFAKLDRKAAVERAKQISHEIKQEIFTELPEVIQRLGEMDCQATLIIVSGVDRRVLDAAQRSARQHCLPLAGALAKPFSRARWPPCSRLARPALGRRWSHRRRRRHDPAGNWHTLLRPAKSARCFSLRSDAAMAA